MVAVADVDMVLGCNQGGSIRIPSSMNGIVGLKSTWGLVPYIGIISLECTIDHAGPKAKTVRDTALLLKASAGPDRIGDSQPLFHLLACSNMHRNLTYGRGPGIEVSCSLLPKLESSKKALQSWAFMTISSTSAVQVQRSRRRACGHLNTQSPKCGDSLDV